ncbi:MAG: TonB-dependent receptor [Ginsengibacter sp.]
MRKLTLLVALLLSSAACLFSQSKEVSGKITDSNTGSPIAGATITTEGAQKATISDPDGSFRITVNDKTESLQISYVGYTTQQVPIGAGFINASLQQEDRSLKEVVVIGFGTKIRRDITGSVSTVSAKEINNTPATSFETAIQGRAAGVLVSQQNGKLGQGINIRIRGSSSVSAGNEPLYVVDGIPLTTDDLSSTVASTNALSDINMNDIQSLEILKDASAAAIYGSRASNGVVLITTKKGKAGQSKIEFGYFTGKQDPTGKRKFLNTQQYVDFFTQAAVGAATQDSIFGYYSTVADALVDEIDYVNSRFKRYSGGNDDWQTAKVNTNWQDLAFQDAPISQYDLNISGGNEKTRFFISGQYLDQTGIIISNSYKRYSGRINLDHQVKDWLGVGMNMNFSRSRNNRISNDDAFSTPIQIVALQPLTPVIDPRTGLASGALDLNTGKPNTNFPLYYNPLLSKDGQFYHTTVNRNLGNVYANASLTKHLTFRSEFGVDQLNQFEENYYGRITARNTGVPNGSGSYLTTTVLDLNTNNYFNYKQTFHEIHDFEGVLGMSYQYRQYDYSTATGEEFPSDAYKKLASAASKTDASSSSSTSTLLSYFTRLNYKLKDKYLLSLSGRIDGSSRFGAGNRYGFFPAGSVGWIISEENFLKSSKLINFLKLKASYGVTGNENIADFGSRGLYSGEGSYGGQAGQIPSQLENPDLKWETTRGSDFGIEASILNNRVSFEVDYYERNTFDLLLNVQIPGTTGFATQLQNLGKLNNKGIEFSINTTNIQSKNFRWTTTLNFGANKNRITFLAGQLIGGDQNKAKEGEPLGVFYAREFAGADPANGDALYYKNTLKSDGSVDRATTNDYNQATDVRIGDPNPKFIYGFGNTFTYKFIDLDVLIQGVQGNDIYNGGGQYMSSSGTNGFDNQTVDQLAAWRKPGDITNVPEARLLYPNGTDPSSRYISDGSYLRMKEVTLGFNLPKTITSRLKIDRVRAYVRGLNLFTITDYKGWDPEVNADYQATNINQGVDFYSAPQVRTIVFGVNIGL